MPGEVPFGKGVLILAMATPLLAAWLYSRARVECEGLPGTPLLGAVPGLSEARLALRRKQPPVEGGRRGQKRRGRRM